MRLRMMGGPLDGRVVWVDEGRATLNVHVTDPADGVNRTLQYRREGGLLHFVRELLPEITS